MIYAPILIPTLCRSEHFIRCVESLKKNSWANHTDVYVALDYPAKESHWEGYNKINEYLEGEFLEFSSFNVIVREENYGSVRNMNELRAEVLKKYDYYIRTDDDCEFSPNFIEYMDKCLEKYEKDPDVIGVTGYSYPIEWKTMPGSTAIKGSLVFPMWGTAFWKDKYLKMKRDLEEDFIGNYVRKYGVDKSYMSVARYVDCMCAATNYDNLLTKCVSDIACGCYIQIKGKYIISPVLSLVRNYGFDGSGEWCQNVDEDEIRGFNAKTYDYRNQNIDDRNNFDLCVDQNFSFDENCPLLDQFDSREDEVIKSCEKKIRIQKILGCTIYKIIWRIVHKHNE